MLNNHTWVGATALNKESGYLCSCRTLSLHRTALEGGRECRENGYSCWLFSRFGVGQIRPLSSGYFFFLGGKGSEVINLECQRRGVVAGVRRKHKEPRKQRTFPESRRINGQQT